MAMLVYALTRPGVVEVHRAGCAAVTDEQNVTRFESPPVLFEADTEAAVRALFGPGGCLDVEECPDLDLTVYRCATAALEGAIAGIGPTVATIGFTATDRPGGYVPELDGYRPGAEQTIRTITVDLAEPMTVWTLAAAVFGATHASGDMALTPLQAAIRATLADGADAWRDMSVGDTVTVGTMTVACTTTGWDAVTRDDNRQEGVEPSPE